MNVDLLNDKDFFENLDAGLLKAQVGSCSCGTKTPDPLHHADHCHYKELVEARVALEVFRKRYTAAMNTPLPERERGLGKRLRKWFFEYNFTKAK